MKIAVLIPFYKTMDTNAVQSLITMFADIHSRGDIYIPVVCQSMYIDKARSFLVKTLVEHVQGVDYVLCIDTDHVYDANAVYGLIKAMEENNLDMLSAGYVGRGRPKHWVHLKAQNPGEQPTAIPVGGPPEVTECDVVGFGFLVMKTAFLKQMWEKHGFKLFSGGIDGDAVKVGDDVKFCELMKAEGKRVCFHAGIKVGHISTVVL